MKDLNKKIKALTGMSGKDFCEKRLGMTRQKFSWRMRKNRIYLIEIIYILALTGETFEDLFLSDQEISALMDEMKSKANRGEPLSEFSKRKLKKSKSRLEFIV